VDVRVERDSFMLKRHLPLHLRWRMILSEKPVSTFPHHGLDERDSKEPNVSILDVSILDVSIPDRTRHIGA